MHGFGQEKGDDRQGTLYTENSTQKIMPPLL